MSSTIWLFLIDKNIEFNQALDSKVKQLVYNVFAMGDFNNVFNLNGR